MSLTQAMLYDDHDKVESRGLGLGHVYRGQVSNSGEVWDRHHSIGVQRQ